MNSAPLFQWLAGPLPTGVAEILEHLRRTPGVRQIAVMPDVHRAAEFCVGTVVATEGVLFPHAVGGDIGCGMLALRFSHAEPAEELLADAQRAARLLGLLETACPGRRHRRGVAPPLPEEAHLPLSQESLEKERDSNSCGGQLGTLGGGNHFVELQTDDAGDLWLMLHTGSRQFGQCVHRHHLVQARRLETGVMAIAADSDAGRAYASDVQAARAWAKANRHHLAMAAVHAVEQVFGASAQLDTRIDCDHNHLSQETQEGQCLFVHRKGATSAHREERGVIPGSMATHSFHTLGRGEVRSLCSSSHGAGRELSRSEARKQVTRQRVRQQLTRAGVWYDPRLESSLVEESPTAYKEIDRVMAAQGDLTTITRKLRPLLIYKARE